MNEMTGSARSREEQILTHAMDIVRESGLASLTMKKVADRVGFTETAAYRYFPNKQALLLGLAEEIGRSLLGPVKSIAGTNAPATERLERILLHHVDFVMQLEGLPMLLLAEAAATGEQELLKRLGAVVEEYLVVVAGIIDEIRPGGGSIDVGDLSLLALGLPVSLAVRQRIAPDALLEDRVRTVLVPFLVRCLAEAPR